ncbi:MAG: TIGR03936 family radical SAM-associated protein [Sedimentisphaerales bacterium]|nr:TIGR03936 family radical SAM-associated protein [Sedimentisphaerales bacterium]
MLVIKFRIGGALRFISHAQTLSVFQRACVRAGMEIRYSQGFNPRPRLSLPLPRPVGVASDDEMLCLRIHRSKGSQENDCITKQVYDSIGAQLPQGFELLSVSVVEGKASFQPCSAKYVLTVRRKYLNEELKATIERLLASDSIKIQRQTAKTKSGIRNRASKVKNIDVRDFFESIELGKDGIIVQCKITPAGSIRVEEILKLLDLDDEKLALPVRRASVQWESN